MGQAMIQPQQGNIIKTDFGNLLVVNADFEKNSYQGYEVKGKVTYTGSGWEILDKEIMHADAVRRAIDKVFSSGLNPVQLKTKLKEELGL